MSLSVLWVQDFRCVRFAELELDTRSNLIYGPNASGKTTLLEAAFILGRGRSFRVGHPSLLVRSGAEEFLVSGRVVSSGSELAVGVRGDRRRREARFEGRSIDSFAELALTLPVQVLDPEVHKLIEEGPSLRRHFMDWGVFHVEHSFRQAWKRYNRALKQRNIALKARQSEKLVRLWDQDLIEQGMIIAACRERYIAALRQFTVDQESMLGYHVELSHFPGWRPAKSLQEALSDAWSIDVTRGMTTVGPHRADLIICAEDMLAKGRVSRGQQKMLAAALILAQQAHRAALGEAPACLLIDDPAAELDVDNLGKLLSAVADIPAQLIVTALDPTAVEAHLSSKLFHVKHGSVE